MVLREFQLAFLGWFYLPVSFVNNFGKYLDRRRPYWKSVAHVLQTKWGNTAFRLLVFDLTESHIKISFYTKVRSLS